MLTIMRSYPLHLYKVKFNIASDIMSGKGPGEPRPMLFDRKSSGIDPLKLKTEHAIVEKKLEEIFIEIKKFTLDNPHPIVQTVLTAKDQVTHAIENQYFAALIAYCDYLQKKFDEQKALLEELIKEASLPKVDDFTETVKGWKAAFDAKMKS